jgi:molybdopterin-synthase adenylyltransferase
VKQNLAPLASPAMNDDQLLRYSRHILLPEIGFEGQERLLASHALVIGAGGLGSPAAMYLASGGVGRITLADGDCVDLTNLQRQILHGTMSVGRAKACSGKDTLAQLNPGVVVEAIPERLEGDRLARLVASADIVLDCSDNFATRHAVNRACVEYRKPLVSGAVIRFDGQVSLFNLRHGESACYNCLFPEGAEAEETRCAVMGVFAPLAGIIGAMQAAEALKLLAGAGESLSGRLLLLNCLRMEWRSVWLSKNPECRVCSSG